MTNSNQFNSEQTAQPLEQEVAASNVPTEHTAVVIVAAGLSTRMAGLDKQFAVAGGKSLLAHTIGVFERSPLVDEIVVVLNENNLLRGRALAYEEGWQKVINIVTGGARRQDSVWSGLQALTRISPKWVLIHDGARPFVDDAILSNGLAIVREYNACVVGVPVKDTIKMVANETMLVEQTPPRERLWAVQTPQFFNYDLICKAHVEAIEKQLDVTDDASLLEILGYPVKIFKGTYTNIKITTPDDLLYAQRFFSETSSDAIPVPHLIATPQSGFELKNQPTSHRIGQGYDVHKLVAGRPLILGGIHIPFEFGLDGHSDADVLTHSIINALLGAAGLGDIGRYFPPSDPAYKGISSLEMLLQIRKLIQEQGWVIINIDATVAAQRPKLGPYASTMRKALATTLNIEFEKINIKATTTEKLGFVGREEGLEAQAIVLISRQT